MRQISIIALIAAGAIAATSSAHGADVYSRGSIKDTGAATYDAGEATRSGFYVTGILGYAFGDRDIKQRTSREAGIFQEVTAPAEADFDRDSDGVLDAEERAEYEECVEEFNRNLDEILQAAPGSSYDGSTLTLPLIGDTFSTRGGDDADSLVFGAEVSYLFHNGGRFGFEPALGVTFYGDSKSSIRHDAALGKTTETILHPAGVDVPDIEDSEGVRLFGQSGYASMQRDFDIDLIGRLYAFTSKNFAITFGAGVSYASGQICARNTSDGTRSRLVTESSPELASFANGAFNSAGCEDVSAFGPMGEIGFKYWATDKLSFVGRIDGKWHGFDANFGSSDKLSLGGEDRTGCCGEEYGDAGIYGKSGSKVDVDDTVWTVKFGVSYQLN